MSRRKIFFSEMAKKSEIAWSEKYMLSIVNKYIFTKPTHFLPLMAHQTTSVFHTYCLMSMKIKLTTEFTSKFKINLLRIIQRNL